MRTLLGVLISVCLANGIEALAEQKVAVMVKSSRSSWIDSRLLQHLEQSADQISGLQVILPAEGVSLPARADDSFDQQRLSELGKEMGIRYLLWCEIAEEKLKLERGFSLPFLFTQQQVCARLVLDCRLVDCRERKSIWWERLEKKCHGPSTLQYFEQTTADDDFHLTYGDRVDLFERLEKETAETVVAKLAGVVNER